MMGFVLACSGMVLIAVALFAWPLLGSKKFSLPSANRWLTVVLTAVVVAVISGGIYIGHLYKNGGEWHADNVPAENSSNVEVSAQLMQTIKQLEEQVAQDPKSVSTLVKLGAANVMAHRADQAVGIYQHAYDLSQGQDIEAVTGLAEALLMKRDEQSFMRGSQLLDEALKLQPLNPKALWYGGMVALQMENPRLARERFRSMLTLNPPDKVRTMLEREVQDLDQQLGDAPASAVADKQNERRIVVNVKIAPTLQAKIKQPMALFVLARNPAQGGPPLAVERHMSTELPLTVELTKAKAMLPTRTIESTEMVEVVARISSSGTPVQQSGDFVGSIQYSFAKQGNQGTVTVEIDHQVP